MSIIPDTHVYGGPLASRSARRAQQRMMTRQAATAKKKSWYRIDNAAGASADEATVYIYDQIAWYGVGSEDFVRDLAAITAATLNVRINSPGGNVFHGVAIYNALHTHPARVITHVDGMAASIASVIALAGEEIRIARGGFIMIHDPFAAAEGTAKELRAVAAVLDKIRDSIAEIYADRMDLTPEEINELMEQETWFSAAEALDAGLVDQVVGAAMDSADDGSPGNGFDLSIYAHVPSLLRAHQQQDSVGATVRGHDTIREFERFLREDGGYSHSAAAAIARGGFRQSAEPRDEDDDQAIVAELHVLEQLIHRIS